jgi:hypothetical protein
MDPSSKAQGIALQTVSSQVGIKISFSLRRGTDHVPPWSLYSIKHDYYRWAKSKSFQAVHYFITLAWPKKCTLSLNDVVVTVHCLSWYCLLTLTTR